MKTTILILFAATVVASAQIYSFSNFAGQPGGPGNADGTGNAARFDYPFGVAVDRGGNVYIADTYNHTIRKITLGGVVITLAGSPGQIGSADGGGSAARFFAPTGVAVDTTGYVYVADYGNSTIRKVSPAGLVTTLAGTAGQFGSVDGASGTRFSDPFGLAVDGAGNVYVADASNHTIRKITPAGVVTTLAGAAGQFGNANGIGGAARFSFPRGVAVDRMGNIYVADNGNASIRKITPGGLVSTLPAPATPFGIAVDAAGNVYVTDGPQGSIWKNQNQLGSGFNQPAGVAVDGAGYAYVADTYNHMIWKIAPTGVRIPLAGTAEQSGSADGVGDGAAFYLPVDVAVDNSGNLYVADQNNHTIRQIAPAGTVTTLAGTVGQAGSTDGGGLFNQPYGTAVDTLGNVYVADPNNHAIRKVTPTGIVTTFAGSLGQSGTTNGSGSAARFNYPLGVTVDNVGNVYVADKNSHTIRAITPAGVVTTLAGSPGVAGSADGTGSAARFSSPFGVAVDNAGNVYVADNGNGMIRKITSAGAVTTLAGGLGYLVSVAVDSAGNVYAADQSGGRILKITSAGAVTTIAGGGYGCADGVGGAARFSGPWGVVVDGGGNVYVADFGNHTIRKITPAAIVTTLAGTCGAAGATDASGSAARFFQPAGITVDRSGNIYVGDTLNHTIRKITPSGLVSTFAGTPRASGAVDFGANAARFNSPGGVAVDGATNVYVADTYNHTIRRIVPGVGVTTIAGSTGQAGSADGSAGAARFYYPAGVAVDNTGNLYVTDNFNHTIRKIAPVGVVTTLAGSAGYYGSVDATGAAARFWSPTGIAVDTGGNAYVADSYNNTIRKITPAGAVTTLAGSPGQNGSVDGTGSAARFNQPEGVAVDNVGNVYVADTFNHTIRRITPAGVVTTIGGTPGVIGHADGIGTLAYFDYPTGVAVDSTGHVYVADSGNNRISKDDIISAVSRPLFGARAVAGGLFHIQVINSSPGSAVVIERSTNLRNWVPVFTNNAALIDFTHPTTDNLGFFRALVQ